MSKPNLIQLEAIRPETASLFTLLANFPQLGGFTLIGGTAIALNIGHRLSNDLDFAFFDDKLPTSDLDSLTIELKSNGLPVRLISTPDHISTKSTATSSLNYSMTP